MPDEISTICSSLLVADIVQHPEKYPSKIAAVRKVCKTMATELGMTRTDLLPTLATKLDEFQKMDDAPEDPYLAS